MVEVQRYMEEQGICRHAAYKIFFWLKKIRTAFCEEMEFSHISFAVLRFFMAVEKSLYVAEYVAVHVPVDGFCVASEKMRTEASSMLNMPIQTE